MPSWLITLTGAIVPVLGIFFGAFLMLFGSVWAVIASVAAAAGRSTSHRDPTWFYVGMSVMFGGLGLVVFSSAQL
jgi:hypothetical protein